MSDLMQMGEVCNELITLRRQRRCLERTCEQYQQELSAASGVLSEAIKGERTASPGPTAEGWPSYEQIVDAHKHLFDVEAKIDGLMVRLREWGALD